MFPWLRRFAPSARSQRPSHRPTLESLEIRALPTAGALNPHFDHGRVEIVNTGTVPGNDSLAVQLDGKAISAGIETDSAGTADGPLEVVRLHTDGSLDRSFGHNGIVQVPIVPIDPNNPEGNSAAVAGVGVTFDGHVVVATITSITQGDNVIGQFDVLRFNNNGTLDTSWGNGGSAVFGTDILLGLGVQVGLDGSVTVAGADGSSELVVSRLNPNGQLDGSFGTGGTQVVTFAGGFFSVPYQGNGLALNYFDNSVVAVGTTQDPNTGATEFAVAKLNRFGQLDPSFGGTGTEAFALPSAADSLIVASSVALTLDGHIVLTGTAMDNNDFSFSFTAVRLNGDGSIDNSFNGGNAVIVVNGASPSDPVNVSVNLLGQIVMAGTYLDPNTGTGAFATVLLNPNGSVNTHFDSSSTDDASPTHDGVIITDVGYTAAPTGVAFLANGTILVAGGSAASPTGPLNFAFAEYNLF